MLRGSMQGFVHDRQALYYCAIPSALFLVFIWRQIFVYLFFCLFSGFPVLSWVACNLEVRDLTAFSSQVLRVELATTPDSRQILTKLIWLALNQQAGCKFTLLLPQPSQLSGIISLFHQVQLCYLKTNFNTLFLKILLAYINYT